MDNISSLRKLEEVFLSDRSDSPRNSQYSQSYHNLETSAKCPRCSNFGELIEDGPVRSLYRCPDCGIFTKLTPKRQDKDGKPIKCRLKNPCQGCGGNQGIIAPVDRSDNSLNDQKGGRDNA